MANVTKSVPLINCCSSRNNLIPCTLNDIIILYYNKCSAPKNVNNNLVANLLSLFKIKTSYSININKNGCLNGNDVLNQMPASSSSPETLCLFFSNGWMRMNYYYVSEFIAFMRLRICIKPSNGLYVWFFHSFSTYRMKFLSGSVVSGPAHRIFMILKQCTNWYKFTSQHKNQHSILIFI